jgi:hypothetical protein
VWPSVEAWLDARFDHYRRQGWPGGVLPLLRENRRQRRAAHGIGGQS